MVFTEHLLAKAVCTKSIKVLGWQPGAPKSREHGFPTKRRDFLKPIGPVTARWALQPTEFMHMVSTEALLARRVFARSNEVLWRQPGAPKPREYDFPTKTS